MRYFFDIIPIYLIIWEFYYLPFLAVAQLSNEPVIFTNPMSTQIVINPSIIHFSGHTHVGYVGPI